MKVGVFSDTHDRLENVQKAIQVFQNEKVSLIIHCGDWVSPFVPQFIYKLEPKLTIPIKSVFGNNEGDHFRFFERKEKDGWNIEFYKDSFEIEIEDKKGAVYHGANKPITDALIKSKKYDVVFTGHTHKSVNEYVDHVLHLNPGSTAGYCEGSFGKMQTVAIYDSAGNAARIINL